MRRFFNLRVDPVSKRADIWLCLRKVVDSEASNAQPQIEAFLACKS